MVSLSHHVYGNAQDGFRLSALSCSFDQYLRGAVENDLFELILTIMTFLFGRGIRKYTLPRKEKLMKHEAFRGLHVDARVGSAGSGVQQWGFGQFKCLFEVQITCWVVRRRR